MLHSRVVPFDRHTQGNAVAFLTAFSAHDSRRHAANAADEDMCPEWLGAAGFCCRMEHHAGGCLPIPADYAPETVQS